MRGPDRRRGSPPPRRGGGEPPQRRGGGYMGGPQGGDRRRQRSVSPPPDRFRRSPPPYKRYRRDDDREDRGFGGRGSDPYDRRRGYRDPYDDRSPRYRDRDYDRPSPPRRDGPMTYREHMLTLHNDVTPDEAQALYQAYLKEWWGSEVRAEFEAKKGEEWMRRQFDPRELQRLVDRRNELAAAHAKGFAEDLASGKLDPKAEEFNQADLQGSAPGPWPPVGDTANGKAEKEGDTAPRPTAPPVTWTEPRLASDLDLSRRLMDKLDAEKGLTELNPLAGASAAGAGAATQPQQQEEGQQQQDQEKAAQQPEQAEGAVAAGDAAAEGAEGAPAQGDGAAAAAAPSEAGPGEGDKAAASGGPSLPEDPAARLDLQLAYLWRVHGVDYYGGREYGGPDDPSRAGARRTLRGPPRKEQQGEEDEAAAKDAGEAPDESAKAELEELTQQVDEIWKPRLEMEDLMEAPLQKARVQEALDEYIESQITKIDDNKWGSKVSAKLFVGKEYVVKHIKVKHAHVVDAERERVLDLVYYDNFQRFKEEEQARRREHAERLAAQHRDAFEGGEGGEFDPALLEEGADPAAAAAALEGAGFLPGPLGAGRGRGGMLGRGGALGPPPLMVGPLDAGPMMPMLGGPPMGQVLVPAPGAGPLGPFIMAPAPMGPMGLDPMGAGGPVPPPVPPPPGRGMPGGRGRGPPGGRGGRGMGPLGGRGPPGGRFGGGGGPPFMMPPHPGGKMHGGRGPGMVKEYHDLDAPQNNRSVLDYGDL